MTKHERAERVRRILLEAAVAERARQLAQKRAQKPPEAQSPPLPKRKAL